MKKALLILSLSLLISNNVFSQEHEKHVGISASLQGNQYGISLPLWLGEKFVLAPGIEAKYAEGIGTDLILGLAPRFYFKNENLAPYFGLKFGAVINFPSTDNTANEDNKVDIIAGLALGAEYFIADQFSVGIEAQGNFTKSADESSRFGNPGGLNFNTGTLITATIYF